MATLTKGKTFTNGETVTPQKLHELVDLGTVSGIVNADIAASAAIADSKLAQISTAGKVLPAAVQGTAVVTADPRLSDARTPVPHWHAISDTTGLQAALDGKQASGSYVVTTDARLSDHRTPTSHNHGAADITVGTLANDRLPARLQAAAQMIYDWNDALENGWYQGNQAANAPDGVLDWWLGYVEVHSALWVTQTVHWFTVDAPTNTQIWRRSSSNVLGVRVWNAWHKLQLSQAEQDARYQASGSYVITTDSRLSDARTPVSHTHDDRYYTETEMNTLLAGKQAAGSYAPATGIAPSAITGTAVVTTDSRLSDARTPVSHTHDDRYYTETEMNTLLAGKQAAGSYAPATGIAPSAITGTAVVTTDSRLSDARTPTTHTHDDRYYTETEMNTLLAGKQASGSYAPATGIAQSAVTNLTTDLAGKAASSHTHDASAITAGTLANARTTASAENTANTIVARDASGNIKGQDLISERFSADLNCGILQFRKGMGTVSNPANTNGSFPNLGIISFNGYSFGAWEQQTAIVVNQIASDFAQRPVGNFEIQTRATNGTFQNRFRITGDGNGVFSGTCSATVLVQTSDVEEKENIDYKFLHGLETIKSLKPVYFDFKGDGPKGNIGFIAQDVVKEIPNAVLSYNKVIYENEKEHEVERLGIKEGHLVAVLVKAVQELAARVAALEAR